MLIDDFSVYIRIVHVNPPPNPAVLIALHSPQCYNLFIEN